MQRVVIEISDTDEIPINATSLSEIFEDIKAEIRQGVSDFANENGDIAHGFACAEEIIDKHIADKMTEEE